MMQCTTYRKSPTILKQSQIDSLLKKLRIERDRHREGSRVEKIILGFVAEVGGGKTTATTFIKTVYPETPSARFSDPLREFIAWFNDCKVAGALTSDHDQCEHALEEGLCAIFPRSHVSRVRNEIGLIHFTDWIFHNWFGEREIPIDREPMQVLSTALRSIFGENILEQTVLSRIAQTQSPSPFVILEGIRREVDISSFLGNPNFVLVYLECDPKIAHARTQLRTENPGDATMSFEEFMHRREAEAEQQIRLLKPRARAVYDNSGTEDELMNWLSGLAASLRCP